MAIPKDRRLAVTIAEAAQMTTLCRRTIANCVKRGQIRVVKIGRRTIIPISSLEALVSKGVETKKAA